MECNGNTICYHTVKKSISIVGAGRVGRALGRELRQRSWKIMSVVAKSSRTARAAVHAIGGGIARTSITKEICDADVILIATPDSVIETVAREIATAARIARKHLPMRGKFVFHCSGVLSSDALAPLAHAGASVASMHPMQTFGTRGNPKLDGVIFGIDGHPRAVRVAQQIAKSLGGIPVTIAPAHKPAYHCAGAFAAPHVLTMMCAGATMLQRIGFSRRQATRALMNLVRQTLHNFETIGGRASYTGPLSRGDYATVARHVQMLQHLFPELVAAYMASTRLGVRLLAKHPKKTLKLLENSWRRK